MNTRVDEIVENASLNPRQRATPVLLESGKTLPKLKGYEHSSIVKLIFENGGGWKNPARSTDGIEQSIQAGISFLQTQGKVLEEIFTLINRIDEIRKQVDEDDSSQTFDSLNSEFVLLRGNLNQNLLISFNKENVFSRNQSIETVKIKVLEKSRAISVERFNIYKLIDPIISKANLLQVSNQSIQSANNMISERLGKNSAAELDLRGRFKLLSNGTTITAAVEPKQLITRTTWMKEMLTHSMPFDTQANINFEKINPLLD